MVTRQVQLGTKPNDKDQSVGLLIKCGNSNYVRFFKINENMHYLKKREIPGLVIDTECSRCGHNIQVSLSWFNTEKGYSYRPFSYTETNYVEDEKGLEELSNK